MKWFASHLLVVFAATGTAFPVFAKEEEHEIVGYTWRCNAEIKNTLGSFTGIRALSDDGKPFEADFASWAEPGYAYFGFHSSINWSTYRVIPVDQSLPVRPLERVPGLITLGFGADKPMPKHAVLRLRRDKAYSRSVGLVLPFNRGAAKNLALTGTMLDDILAYATGQDTLFWTIEDTDAKNFYDKLFAEGTLAIAPIRAAQASLPQIAAALDAKTANFRTECRRFPVYDDPLAEI